MSGRTAEATKGNTLMTKNTGLESLPGLTAEGTKEGGRKISSMGLVCWLSFIRVGKENGLKEIG